MCLSQVRQNIGDVQYRIRRIQTHLHVDQTAVGFGDYTDESKRHADPLIFFDAAVVMRAEKYQAVFFIERVRL